MPLLAGPGAISTIIIYADASPHIRHLTMLVISSVLVALLTWVALNIASPLRTRDEQDSNQYRDPPHGPASGGH